eukprot:1160280-Pelagomonas_calceolata.AAC.3
MDITWLRALKDPSSHTGMQSSTLQHDNNASTSFVEGLCSARDARSNLGSQSRQGLSRSRTFEMTICKTCISWASLGFCWELMGTLGAERHEHDSWQPRSYLQNTHDKAQTTFCRYCALEGHQSHLAVHAALELCTAPLSLQGVLSAMQQLTTELTSERCPSHRVLYSLRCVRCDASVAQKAKSIDF